MCCKDVKVEEYVWCFLKDMDTSDEYRIKSNLNVFEFAYFNKESFSQLFSYMKCKGTFLTDFPKLKTFSTIP